MPFAETALEPYISAETL
ncbi:MAG: hypothetical protein JXM70_07360 [Pirellulales bacterium]|nr:hypothetical protein [Pirellulales bacterium]